MVKSMLNINYEFSHFNVEKLGQTEEVLNIVGYIIYWY